MEQNFVTTLQVAQNLDRSTSKQNPLRAKLTYSGYSSILLPYFHFTSVATEGTEKAGKLGALYIYGICALTVVTDQEEMKSSSSETENFFEGV